MPVKRRPQITAGSHSRLKCYETCPRKAKLQNVDRIREPTSEPMLRGSHTHKLAEDYAIGRLTELPKELDRFAEEFKHLRRIKRRLSVELELAVTSSWEPCDWFAKDAWLRAKIDAMYFEDDGRRVIAIDHKTGKVRPEDKVQLDLYTPAIFAHYPEVRNVRSELWYLDWGEVVTQAYERGADEKRLRKAVEKRMKPMLADRTFDPTPSRLCSWCWYGQSKKSEGGPGLCEY